jgi:hypothetical protein
MNKIKLNKLLILTILAILGVLVILNLGSSENEILKKWEANPKIKYYGERFYFQNKLTFIARYDSGYTFDTVNGYSAYIVPSDGLYQWTDKSFEKHNVNGLDALLKHVGLTKLEYTYWSNALEELDTYEISKVAYTRCDNTYISAYKEAPAFFDASATGWFYFNKDVKHREYCIEKDNIFEQFFNKNDYFSTIYQVTDEWYYAIEK